MQLLKDRSDPSATPVSATLVCELDEYFSTFPTLGGELQANEKWLHQVQS